MFEQKLKIILSHIDRFDGSDIIKESIKEKLAISFDEYRDKVSKSIFSLVDMSSVNKINKNILKTTQSDVECDIKELDEDFEIEYEEDLEEVEEEQEEGEYYEE